MTEPSESAAPKRTGLKRYGRRVLVAVAATIGLLLAVVMGAFAWLQSDGGRAWLAAEIAAALTTPGEQEATLEGLEGSIPGAVRLAELRLADKDGVWLRVERARLDWSPLALLTRRLEIERLAAARIEIARLPQSEAIEEDADDAFALPSLPVDIALQKLIVEELALGADVLGSPAAFRIEGEAAARADEALRSALRISRTDGAAGEVAASATYRPQDDHLALELTVGEPAGGLIARMLELADLPAVEVQLVGEGPVSDWSGRLTLDLDGLAEAEADLSLRRDPEPLLRMVGSALLQSPADLKPLLDGRQAFEIEAAWRDEQRLEIGRASVRNDLGSVEIAGSLDMESLATDATARVSVPDADALGDLLAPLALGSLTANAKASGPLLQPDVTLDVTLRELSAPSVTAFDTTLKITAKPDGPLDDDATTTALLTNVIVNGLAVEPTDITAPLLGQNATLNLEAALTAAALDLSRVQLNAGGVALEGAGRIGLNSGDIVLSSQIALDDVGRLEAASGLPAHGAVALHADIDAADFGASLRAALDGSLSDLSLGIPAVDSLVGPAPTFGADIALSGDGLAVNAARVQGAEVWATGDASLPPDFASITATLAAGLDDLQKLTEITGLQLAGSAALEAQVIGPLSAPTSNGLITSEGTRVEDFDLGRITVAYEARDLVEAPAGQLELSLNAPALRLNGGTAFMLSETALTLSETQLASEDTQLSGALSVPLDGAAMTGEFTLEAARLTPWLDLAGLSGSAALGARLRLSGNGPRQAVDFSASLRDLRYPLGKGDSLTIDSGEITARIADLAKPSEGDVSASLAKLTAGPATLAETSVTARGSAGGADFELSTRGDLLGTLALDAVGRFEQVGDAITLSLTTFEGTVVDRPLTLRQATTLSLDGDDMALDGLDLEFAGATVSADGRLSQEVLQADLTLHGLPLELAKLAAPESAVDGTLSATLRLEGPRRDPRGTARFEVPDLRLGDLPDLPEITAEMDADWRQGRLALTAEIAGFAETPARLEAALPLRLDPESLVPAAPENEAVSGRLDWSGDLAQIWPLVPIDGHRLSGGVELAAALDGTLADPNLSGALNLTGGAYENFETGTLLEELALTLDLEGDQAVLKNLSATDGDNGQLSVEGQLAVLPEESFPFSIRTDFQDFAVLRRDDITAVKSGELTIDGSLDSMSIEGQLRAKRIEILLSRNLPPQVVDLDVVEVNGGDERAEAEEAAESAGSEIALALLVDLPGQVFVRGLGLDSEWSGKLTVKGTAAAPVIDGNISVLRGQMSIIGKTFVIDSGSVSFTGASEIDPILDIEAKNESGDLTVIAKVTGPASQPEFALSSVPSLPQDEIVAQMLFGKNTSQLSSIEAIQLAQAVAELSGKGGSGGGVLDFTRNLLGLDVLRVESDDTGGPAVGAGKYVTDDVYVGVKQGTAAGSGTVGVEVELTPNISLKSDVGQTGESDIGVNFKWDY